MADVKIQVLDNGPLVVSGSVELVDGDGNQLKQGNNGEPIYLCRCGLAKNEPYCDGSHEGKLESKVRA